MRPLLVLLALLIPAGLVAGTRTAPIQAPPHRIHEWPVPSRAGDRLTQPSGLAVDSTGAVYVVELGSDRVGKYSGLGRSLATWAPRPARTAPSGSPSGWRWAPTTPCT